MWNTCWHPDTTQPAPDLLKIVRATLALWASPSISCISREIPRLGSPKDHLFDGLGLPRESVEPPRGRLRCYPGQLASGANSGKMWFQNRCNAVEVLLPVVPTTGRQNEFSMPPLYQTSVEKSSLQCFRSVHSECIWSICNKSFGWAHTQKWTEVIGKFPNCFPDQHTFSLQART